MFGFQKDITRWALAKGRAAVFSDCGTGKTLIELEFGHQVCKHTGGKALIVAPLAVVEQTKREGEKFGIEATVCASQNDVKYGVNITNYEKLEHFVANEFDCIILDESSILKSFTGKIRTQLQKTGALDRPWLRRYHHGAGGLLPDKSPTDKKHFHGSVFPSEHLRCG